MKKLDLVNAKIGSNNKSGRFSHGNIYPVTGVPHGMTNWCIQNNGKDPSWFYNSEERDFEGIRLTHQPSPWVGDYGHVLFFPHSGKVKMEAISMSAYRPEETIIKPNYIGIKLLRYMEYVEVAPTERGGIIKISNSSSECTSFAILPFGPSEFKLEGDTITGFTDTKYCFGSRDVREYLYIKLSSEGFEKVDEQNGGLTIYFNEKVVTIKIATSFISVEQAKVTFERELKSDLEVVSKEVENLWEEQLNKIEVKGNIERMKTFYSCFYRALLYPRKFYEIDKDGNIKHFNPDTKKVYDGYFYNDNGFWDTYRTVYPLLSIIDKDIYKEMVEAFVNYYEEVGYLPRWLSAGELGIMPGTLVEAVIADAVVKGVIDEKLARRAYKGLINNAYNQSSDSRMGRLGVADYMKYGYLPREKYKESVNQTLDCAYGDFCISQVARFLGENEEAEKLYNRSKNYMNIFDKETGFMRGKDESGKMADNFSSIAWGGEYTEGSAWQSSFAVPHDIEGLAKLYGSKEKMIEKLDELFTMEPKFEVGGYGFQIHEMSEMAALDFGQCAISNQPSFHFPYLFNMLGDRKKTEYWVEKLVDGAFSSNDDGFPGDEDNGTMGAWYMFSCLGFYPVCPGKDEYISSKPLFKFIKINGKKICRFKQDRISNKDIC